MTLLSPQPATAGTVAAQTAPERHLGNVPVEPGPLIEGRLCDLTEVDADLAHGIAASSPWSVSSLARR